MSTYEANRYSFPTSAITSGTFDDARFAASNITQHVTNTTEASGTWTLNPIVGGVTVQSSRYVRVGKLVSLQAWGIGNGGSYPGSNYNSNRFYFTGAPITSMNTGNAADCVGMGIMHTKNSNKSIGAFTVWILSNSTQIRIGLMGKGRMKAANSNHTAHDEGVSLEPSGMDNARFNISWANMSADFENNANNHWNFHMEYYVD
tara:strand:- start:380 stop:988 length:609 start_codon:yes stop_codon:yes gene_type:complete